MNIGETLLPPLRLQKRRGGVASRTLNGNVAEPDDQTTVIGGHVEDAHPWSTEMVSDPGADQHEFDDGKRAEAEGDAEAMLAATDAHIMREEKQEEHHPNLDNAHASLRGDNGLHPGRKVRRVGRDRDDSGHKQHDEAGPLEEHGTQIAQCMEGAKNVDENLVNHAKAEGHAHGVADPREVKSGGIVMPECGKEDGEDDDLGDNVTKEEFEFAVQAPVNHHSGDSHLKDGMCDPERVIENFNFVAHHSVAGTSR